MKIRIKRNKGLIIIIHKFNLELFKEMYENSNIQKEVINSKVSIPLSILPFLCGGAIYYFDKINELRFCSWQIIFYILFGLFVISILVCFYLLYRTYFGLEYKYFPTPFEIHKQTVEYINYYDNNYDEYFRSEEGPTKDNLIKDDLNRKFYEIYKDAAEYNINSNYKKVAFFRFLGYALAVAIIFGALSIVPFYMSLDKNEVQKVQIVNLSK